MRLPIPLVRPLALVALAAVPLSACGGDDEETPGQAFARRYAAAYCEGAATCCAQTGEPHDVAACKQFVGVFAGMAAAGSGKFSQSAADECLAGVDAAMAACDDDQLPPACDQVFVGSEPPGGPCTTSADCAPSPDGDVTCWYSFESESEQGRCAVKLAPAEGQPCSSDDPNATVMYQCSSSDDFFCDWSTNLCKKNIALGQPCDYSTTCAKGAVCSQDLCIARTPLGGDCTVVSCVEEGYCVAGKCAPLKQAGESCTDFTECQSGWCNTTTGTCDDSMSGSGMCFDPGS